MLVKTVLNIFGCGDWTVCVWILQELESSTIYKALYWVFLMLGKKIWTETRHPYEDRAVVKDDGIMSNAGTRLRVVNRVRLQRQRCLSCLVRFLQTRLAEPSAVAKPSPHSLVCGVLLKSYQVHFFMTDAVLSLVFKLKAQFSPQGTAAFITPLLV